jgi:hypothetical protein
MPHPAAPRPRARLMGRPHHPAGPDAEPMRACSFRESSRGKDLAALRSHADRGFAAIDARPRRLSAARIQSPSAAATLPLRHLDRVPTPRGRASAGHLPTHLGFSPLPMCATARGKESGGGEKGVVQRVAADVPLLGVVHERVEPDLSPHGEGNVRVGRETGAVREAEHHRVHLPDAAFFVKSATTTSPSPLGNFWPSGTFGPLPAHLIADS